MSPGDGDAMVERLAQEIPKSSAWRLVPEGARSVGFAEGRFVRLH